MVCINPKTINNWAASGRQVPFLENTWRRLEPSLNLGTGVEIKRESFKCFVNSTGCADAVRNHYPIKHIHPQFFGTGERTGYVEVNQSRSTKYGRNGTRSQRKGALVWPRKPEIGRRPDEWELYHKELIRIASISCLLICQECPCQHQ